MQSLYMAVSQSLLGGAVPEILCFSAKFRLDTALLIDVGSYEKQGHAALPMFSANSRCVAEDRREIMIQSSPGEAQSELMCVGSSRCW